MATALEEGFSDAKDWLLFKTGPTSLPPNTGDGLAVVVDNVCEGKCENMLAHHFHRPELWFLFSQNHLMLGFGWQLGKSGPPRHLDNSTVANLVRYAVVGDGVRSETMFSKKLDGLIVLGHLVEGENGAVSCHHQLVGGNGEVKGNPENSMILRQCPACLLDGWACSCTQQAADMAYDGLPPHTRLTKAVRLKEKSVKSIWKLTAGKKTVRLMSHHWEEQESVAACQKYVQLTYVEKKQKLTKNATMLASHALKSEKVCPICNAGFVKPYDLRRHYESVHCGVKRHQCQYCRRTFSQTGHLNEHVRVFHLMTSSCRCDVCGKCFGARSKLLRHVMAVHENRRLYSCETCGKSFKERSHVNKHCMSHK
uniref:C2H2-type domain-containing protein n=1 Tax=Rhodosorus marinus TaxID=101924 RepID=A0A7S2ZLU5_9RHOD|mmetsp:Transcript_23398/g.92955  ORF Transcript_23398/g.92955 Transcript_23398/m.92955 type:complete len:367 (+) Transcript_23398:216-1316(+)